MNGRPLVSEKFQSADSIPNETLLAGLFTAIQGFMYEVTHDEAKLNSITVDNLSYHFKSYGKYQIVLVTDLSETPKVVMQKIGLRFMKEHGEQLFNETTDKTMFEPFIQSINEIIMEKSISDDSRMINPTKKFSPDELFRFSPDIRAIALALITIKEGSVDEIAAESNTDISVTQQHLRILQKKGFIGKRTTGEKITYFCSI